MNNIKQAFKAVNRDNFVPEELRSQAYIDAPLPIGYGQTISQPTTVGLMLEWLEVEPGNKILDVGSGSGWTSALLGYLVGSAGYIYAVEKIPELVRFGRENLKRTAINNVKFYQAGENYGLPHQAPFDRILVSAAAEQVPKELPRQLKAGGKIVIPINNDILEITKISPNKYETKTHPGFVFVPLV